MRIDRRSLLALLGASAAKPAAAQGPEGAPRFDHGVASGDPQRDRVVIWTRLTGLGQGRMLEWQVARDAEFTRLVRSGLVEASAGRDFTAKVDVAGLEPATDYFYRFRIAGGELSSPVGRTRTLPAGPTEQVVLAVASCGLFPNGYFNAYQAIADLPRVDAVIHLGDYIYELPGGPGGYGMNSPVAAERSPDPPHETVTLADYRRRLAQYRGDLQLQAAHARAPWIVSWDDHETTNDSHAAGAQNHQPSEGSWAVRKANALRAYYEWMPIREPRPGQGLAEASVRSFDFGDLARLVMIETRLTGRDPQLSYARDLPVNEGRPDAGAFRDKLEDSGRRMMDVGQAAWLGEQLAASVRSGQAWQVIGNQVLMARIVSPDPATDFTPEELSRLDEAGRRRIAGWATASALKLPFSLDSWGGYPADRERLYDLFRRTGARPLVLAGDSHCFWANELHDAQGRRVACEFGTTAVTSPGGGDYLPGVDIGAIYARKNREVAFSDQTAKGFLLLSLTRGEARGEMIAVSTIHAKAFTTRLTKGFRVRPEGAGVSALSPF